MSVDFTFINGCIQSGATFPYQEQKAAFLSLLASRLQYKDCEKSTAKTSLFHL